MHSVRDRAQKFLDELEYIREDNLAVAEEGLHTLMKSKNEHIRLRALEIFLRTQGKKRSYNEKQELDVTTQGQQITPVPKTEAHHHNGRWDSEKYVEGKWRGVLN